MKSVYKEKICKCLHWETLNNNQKMRKNLRARTDFSLTHWSQSDWVPFTSRGLFFLFAVVGSGLVLVGGAAYQHSNPQRAQLTPVSTARGWQIITSPFPEIWMDRTNQKEKRPKQKPQNRFQNCFKKKQKKTDEFLNELTHPHFPFYFFSQTKPEIILMR